MKKRIISLIIFMCLLIIIPTSIWAVTGGGTGDSGSGGGTGGSGTVANTFYYQFGGPDAIRTGAYKYELAYFNKDGSREILSTVIAQGDTYLSYGNSGIIIQRVKEYYEYLKGRNSNVHYTTSGELVNLANQIENGYAVSDLFPGMTVESAEWILNVILDSNTGFGMSETDMQREQDQNPGTIDSYGYRILIQKIQLYGVGGSYTNSFAAPRKEVASDMISNGGVYSRIGRCVQLFGRQTGYARELYTEQDDVHIKNGTNSKGNIGRYSDGSSFVRWCNNNGIGFSWGSSEDKTSALADWQDGLGYNILWFTTDPFGDYDYSVDMAYTDCDSTDPENIAYVIKDTDNWGAILNSGSSENSNVQGYFDKGNDIFCREEFTIYFPNANNQIYVDPGRFFVLYPEDSDLAALRAFGASPIPNLKPYKVYRMRECQAKLVQGEKETDAEFIARQQAALSNYESQNKEDFYSDMGTMYFKYNETYAESKYSMDNPDKFNLYNVYKSNPEKDYKMGMATEGKTVTMTMENTNLYKLPDNYYRYIRLSDGLSMHEKGEKGKYKDVGISNLPVSYENHGIKVNDTTAIAAYIQFGYDLPGESSGSQIGQAVSDKDFLATEDPGDNIYKQYINGDYSDSVREQLENSACAELYGFGTSKFDECARERVNDKRGDNLDGLSFETFNSSVGSNYICKILTTTTPDDPDNPDNPDNPDGCNSPQDAEDMQLDWNSKEGYCCPPGTEYNSSNGTCEKDGVPTDPPGDNDGGSCKTEEDADRLKVSWNPVTKSCCARGTTYDSSTGMCLAGNETDYVCPESDCPYGCCPSGECAPMPTINGEPYCPGPGGSTDVIYRTIDLEDPFPGQDAENRDTGSNWCSYVNGVYSCAYNNLTVKNHITREKSSGKKEGSKVYDENHVLYEVTLDTATIKKIRNYNDDNKYDNWDLSCIDNGKACISKFLDDEIEVTGECANADSKSEFNTCNKAV